MACELPGLISVNDGAIDLVRDGENGFLLKEPTEPAAVLETVKRALASGEEGRARLGQAAREAVLPLTWEAHLHKWLAVIAEVTPETA
jgi:glycosyltransferase involved in cell wall biosynthesis